MSAGMSSIRTTKASSSTPKASPKPIERMMVDSEKMNPPKTDTMMRAAATTTERPARKPCATASLAEAPCTYASRIPEARNS